MISSSSSCVYISCAYAHTDSLVPRPLPHVTRPSFFSVYIENMGVAWGRGYTTALYASKGCQQAPMYKINTLYADAEAQ